MTDAIRTTNGYQKTGDLITLPYTEITEIEQQYASTTVNLNPYDTISFVGNVVHLIQIKMIGWKLKHYLK